MKILRQMACLAGIATMIYLESRGGNALSSVEWFMGAAISALGLWPILNWVLRPKNRFPVYECFCFTFAVYYGFPFLNGRNGSFGRWVLDSDVRVYTGALLLASLVLVHILFIAMTRGRKRRELRIFLTLPEARSDRLFLAILFCSTIVLIGVGNGWLFSIFGPFMVIVRTIFEGASIISGFVLARRFGERKLSRASAFWMVILIVTLCILNISTIFLVAAARLLAPVFIGFTIGRGRAPFVTMLATFAVFTFLNYGKADMRELYWSETAMAPVGTIGERMKDWFHLSMEAIRKEGEDYSLQERLNFVNVLGVIVEESPSNVPYLYGESYWAAVYLWIPRFIWPDKPSGHQSTVFLTTRYGIQSEEDALYTSVGVGLYGEAYANFGPIGVLGLSAAAAAFFAFAERVGRYSSTLTLRGLIMPIYLVSAIQLEAAMSSWIVNIINMNIAIFSVFGWLLIRKVVRRRKPV